MLHFILQGQEESGGIGVGVFIAVIIICAAVFFVLGLMVNKYWGKRRARSFNVEQVNYIISEEEVKCVFDIL